VRPKQVIHWPNFVDGTGSGSCPMAAFVVSGVEPWGSATRQLWSRNRARWHLPNIISVH